MATAAAPAAPVYRSKVFFDLDVRDGDHHDGNDRAFLHTGDGLLLHLAIADDNEHVLRLLLSLRQSAPHYRSDPRLRVNRVLQCAIAYERWHLLPWLARVLLASEPEWEWEPDLMRLAVAQRNVTLMDWLVSVCPDASVSLSARRMEVCASSDLALVTWLHTHGYAPFSVWMMNGAAAHGALDVVQFLHVYRSEGCSTHAMDLAARYGHLDVVQFLHRHRSEGCTSKALDGAAQNGHVDVVQFLLAHRRDVCDVASAKQFARMHDQRSVIACLDAFSST